MSADRREAGRQRHRKKRVADRRRLAGVLRGGLRRVSAYVELLAEELESENEEGEP